MLDADYRSWPRWLIDAEIQRRWRGTESNFKGTRGRLSEAKHIAAVFIEVK
jgi:hypothetical protein